jgi:uncharacterized membrane protein YqjE
MSTSSSASENANMQKANRYCSAALIFFSLAIFFLSVVLFTFNPTTTLGILTLSIGVLLMLGCIFCLTRYSHYLKKAEESVSRSR